MQGFDPNFLSGEKSHSQHLFYGVIRHLYRLDGALERLLKRRPRKTLMAVMRVSGYEMLAAGQDVERIPQIVDWAVAQTRLRLSRPESRLVNAVLRAFPGAVCEWESSLDATSLSDLARLHSHPEWLVRRWEERWGLASTIRILLWNQQTPETWAALGDPELAWPGAEITIFSQIPFARIRDGADWEAVLPLVASGGAYLQDPATRLAPEAAGVEEGTSVLDLCSAPGGKAWQIARRKPGLLVSVDRGPRGSGRRYARWNENIERLGPTAVRVVCELEAEDLGKHLRDVVGRDRFDRVLIDVPCSNTGVMRRRPEVRWNLTEQSLRERVATQARLLRLAAHHVAAGGRLIYSTCSIEPEENERLAESFSGESGGVFSFENALVSVPPEGGHDGAGVFTWLRQ